MAIAISCCAWITISAQEIDLKGKIVDVDEAGINNAFLKLISAGMADTTDNNGAFHLSRKPALLFATKEKFHYSDGGVFALSRDNAATSIEFFDLSGKRLGIVNIKEKVSAVQPQTISQTFLSTIASSLIIARRNSRGGSILNKAIVLAGGMSPVSVISQKHKLAKITAVEDTLEIVREGYTGRKIAIADYIQDLGSLTLQKEVVEDTFTIRRPSERTLSCPDRLSGNLIETKLWDVDLLCESNNDSLQATLYVQAQPDSCESLMMPAMYRYKVEKAWVKIDGSIQPVSPASYDRGGNHHNDWVSFTLNGKIYKLYHSSFGFGWRACTRPDCMQICEDAECRTIRYDGCKRTACSDAPPLKVTCVQIKNDGTVPELLDPWTAHNGHNANPILPCYGDSKCQQ